MKKIIFVIFFVLISTKAWAIISPPYIEKSYDPNGTIITIPVSEVAAQFPEVIDVSLVTIKNVGRSITKFCKLSENQIELTAEKRSKTVSVRIEPSTNLVGSYQTYVNFKTKGNISNETSTLILLTFPGGKKKPGMEINNGSSFEIKLTNGGEVYYNVAQGKLRLRNVITHRIVKTVLIEFQGTIFPGREKFAYVKVPPLATGKYRAECEFSISWPPNEVGKLKLSEFAELPVTPEMFGGEKISPLIVDKPEIIIEGNRKSFSLRLQNSGSEEIKGLKIITPEWIKVLTELPANYVLGAGRSRGIRFSLMPGIISRNGEIAFECNLGTTSAKVKEKE